MFKSTHHVFCAIDSIGGGEGATGAAPTTLVDSLSGVNGQKEDLIGQESSVLSSAQKDSDILSQTQEALSFPEKYIVKKEDGSLDTEASTRKLVDGYNNLSKKLGVTGGVVPDNAEGYKINIDIEGLKLPDGFNSEMVQNDPDFKSFTEEAHRAGFTNDQINLVANKYVSLVNDIITRKENCDADACKKELMEIWATPEEMSTGINNAMKAFNYFASEADKANIDVIGNNPLIIRLLANVGLKMREDAPVRNPQSSESRETIQSLMQSDAYLDPKHPDHARVYQQVTQYYNKNVRDSEE